MKESGREKESDMKNNIHSLCSSCTLLLAILLVKKYD